jgi:enoyl-CoA hydratase/carnithine racemase
MPRVRFEQDCDVGIITISDPPLNLFSLDLIAELTMATTEAEVPSVRSLLLRSDGEYFTAGAHADDVFGNLPEAEGEARIAGFLELARRTERLPFPILAAVRGRCLAGTRVRTPACRRPDTRLPRHKAAPAYLPRAWHRRGRLAECTRLCTAVRDR